MRFVVLVVIGLIVYGTIGYFAWSYAYDNYDYNIFSLGNIIRGIFAVIIGGIGAFLLLSSGNHGLNWDPGVVILLVISALLFLWNFIDTLVNTNFFIAIISFVYQLTAVVLIIKIVNRIFYPND